MINSRFLITLTLLTSPFLLACNNPWGVVTAQFGTVLIDIATCSLEQMEQCEEIKARLEAEEVVTVIDPEHIKDLSRYLGDYRDYDGIPDEFWPVVFNKIYPTVNKNEWISEVWILKDGRLRELEDVASLSDGFWLDLVFSSIYGYVIRSSDEYDPLTYLKFIYKSIVSKCDAIAAEKSLVKN